MRLLKKMLEDNTLQNRFAYNYWIFRIWKRSREQAWINISKETMTVAAAGSATQRQQGGVISLTKSQRRAITDWFRKTLFSRQPYAMRLE
jgi:hypothetical protein